MIRLTWIQVAVFLILALGATWLRGLQAEVVIGWIILVPLLSLMILTAYEVRRVILGVGALVIAAIIFVSSLLWPEGSSVDPDYLQDIAIGAAALALWLFAWDVRTDEVVPKVGLTAAVVVLLSLLTFLALSLARGAEAFASPKMVLAVSAVAALYDMADKRWKVPLAIVALVVAIVFAIQLSKSMPVRPNFGVKLARPAFDPAAELPTSSPA